MNGRMKTRKKLAKAGIVRMIISSFSKKESVSRQSVMLIGGKGLTKIMGGNKGNLSYPNSATLQSTGCPMSGRQEPMAAAEPVVIELLQARAGPTTPGGRVTMLMTADSSPTGIGRITGIAAPARIKAGKAVIPPRRKARPGPGATGAALAPMWVVGLAFSPGPASVSGRRCANG
jgi:hypothetical protein